MIAIPIVVIAALILVNALYVAAEFAAVGVRRSRIHQLAQDGNALARQLLPVLEDTAKLDRYIAACQIGITISSLVAGAYGQAAVAPLLAPSLGVSGAAITVLISLTVLQVVLGELVPKSLALQFPTQVALYTYPPMRVSLWLYSWFIAVLNGSGLLLLKPLGVTPGGHGHIHSPEEIDMLIVESRDGGLLEADESRRLQQALQLGLMPVQQLMVPRRDIRALEVNTPIRDAVREVADSPFTRLPLYEDSIDQVVGVIHTKDLALAWVEHGDAIGLRDVMRPVLTVPERVSADRVMRMMRDHHTQQAIVVDEYGGVDGLVTMEDILAEMLGDIADEFKSDEPAPERLPDGRVRLPGRLRLDEAEPWLGLLWQGRSDTVGGHVFDTVGHLPEVGETVKIDGMDVEIESVEGHAVASVLVVPAPPEGAEEETSS